MDVKPGARLRSAACDAEFIVVKWSAGAEGELRCGGHRLLAADEAKPEGVAPVAGFTEPSLIGKRYTDAAGAIEVLCTKGGATTLSLDDVPMALKDAKPLPASD